jgi:hypothetical protein
MFAKAAKFAARQVPMHLVGSLVHVSIPIQVDPSGFTKRNFPENFAFFESEEPEIASSRATDPAIKQTSKSYRDNIMTPEPLEADVALRHEFDGGFM